MFDYLKTMDLAKAVLKSEAMALEKLADNLDQPFLQAVELLLNCKGRVVVSGVGKSGHIGRKLAATLASTGTPAFFVHAAEAAHGDLGMITKDDVVIGISNSGTTSELLTIIPVLRREGTPLIAITSAPQSPLAKYADVHLDVFVSREACPLNLAPTTSTTATLALGDALAIACLSVKGFQKEDFARSHPGGALGRRLLVSVKDVMRTGDLIPKVFECASVMDAIRATSGKHLGMTVVVDESNKVKGVFTEGDLRRLINELGDIRGVLIKDVMSKKPITISPSELASKAVFFINEFSIHQLVVVDEDGCLVGVLHVHDLMTSKVI